MELDKDLYKEIKEYCELNGIKTKEYIHNLLKKAFMVDKYGECPPMVKAKKKNTSPELKLENTGNTTTSVAEEKPDFNEVYEKISKTEEFKKAYSGKSLGDFIPVENNDIKEKPIVKTRKRKLK